MAKQKFTDLVASLENSDGVARAVDTKEVDSSVSAKDEINHANSEADGAPKNHIADTPDHQVSAGTDDITATTKEEREGMEREHQKLLKLSDTKAACEAYLAILEGNRYTGVPSATMRVIRNDLQGLYPKSFANLAPSLEAFDDDLKRVTASNEAMDYLKDKAGKAGAGIAAAMVKFWEWVKKHANKLKAMLEKLLGRLGKGKQAALLLKQDPKGNAVEAAKLIGYTPTQKAAEGEQPDAKEESVFRDEADLSLLSSSRNDLFDTDGGDLKMMDILVNKYLPAAEENVQKLLAALVGNGSIMQSMHVNSFKDALNSIDVEFKDILPGNKRLTMDDNGWAVRMESEGEAEKIQYIKLESINVVASHIDHNIKLYEVLEKVGKRWSGVVNNLLAAKIEKDAILDAGDGAEVKRVITEYISTLMGSNFNQIIAHMLKVSLARTRILTGMATMTVK